MRREFAVISIAVLAVIVIAGLRYRPIWWALVVVGPLFVLGWYDYLQSQHAVKRNFPLVGNFRYLLELIRPEIQQYFIENDTDGTPF